MKYLLVLLSIILALIPAVYADDDKWIDGIRFRPGSHYRNPIVIYMPSKIEKRINPFFSSPPDAGAIAGRDQAKSSFPFALSLPETLMTSWSFRGGLFEFEFPTEVQDLIPGVGSLEGTSYEDPNLNSSNAIAYIDGKTLILRSSYKTSLYNDFFNTSDKAFADANSNWALSADVTSSLITLGYYFGVFIPIGDYHRFFKYGFGIGIYYLDFSVKLNLCSQYKVTPKIDGEEDEKYSKGECVGKTEIDSYSGKKLGGSSGSFFTLWERVTKDSIWRVYSINDVYADGDIKLKNHTKNLGLNIQAMSWEIVSYTYRF